MKSTIKFLFIFSLFSLILVSCSKEEEENELHIEFKTGENYISKDTTLAAGIVGTIGVNADTEKPKDPIISFNISESVNGGTDSTVYNQASLSTAEFDYDFNFNINGDSGDMHAYTFTITNKDGFTKQTSLILTVK